MLNGVDIQQSPFRQRGFVAAAGFVGVIALAGLIVASAHLLGGGRVAPRAHARSAAVPPSAAPVASAPVGSRSAACPSLPSGGQAVPTGTPVGTRWLLVGDMAEPSAPSTVGPERRVDGFWECYAHSPLGALYAAENVIAAFSAQPQSTVIAALAVPGHARDVAVRQAAKGTTVTSSRSPAAHRR